MVFVSCVVLLTGGSVRLKRRALYINKVGGTSEVEG